MSAKAAATVATVPFTVPKQIKRSKTAVLKALSSTVGTDTTAPHYQFIDDPLTIPSSNFAKRNYFLAKEFGKRAAKQLAKEWPTLFMFDRDEPRLPVFRPENIPALIDTEEPSEKLLANLIEEKQVAGALKVYEKIRAAKVDVSGEVLDKLFKLSAYYNGQDPPISEETEWPGIRNYFEDVDSKWEHNGPTELLFQSVEHNAENYSILIASKAKYGDIAAREQAYKHLQEMEKKELVSEEYVFYTLLRNEQNPKKADEILQRMAKANVKPSIRTINAYIMCVNKIVKFEEKWKKVKQALAEANRLRLVPSLTTYDLVLGGLRSQRPQEGQPPAQQQDPVLAVTALNEILDILEASSTIVPVDNTDQSFFVTAMTIATTANNSDLVDRIENLYKTDKNTVKLTAFTVEAVYYSKYLNFKIFNQLSDLNEIYDLYTALVPRVPDNTPWPLLKRVIEDGIAGRQIVDTELGRLFLKNLANVDVNSLDLRQLEQFRNLITRINDIWQELANFTDERLKHRQIKLRPSMALQLANLFLKVGETRKAFVIISLITEADPEVLNLEDRPHLETLLSLFDATIETNDVTQTANVLELVCRYYKDGPLEQLAEKINGKFVLNATQKRVITNFVKLRNV
ncbi:unnamed protein product [Bursaphelenchus okinawaensis]|uniref:Protein PTCD3 homolog, mitochondrial n=1 Tax=Bursaphelenchus okinawaensis TaxID=465554 RepID=A0A811KUJ1_9BILA|nr:unnamed protein product [Bursaphelenchus okinawaensis]CAG9111292.1 unnamed protein product [Bursaphelenchus okinawaensis]